MNFIGYMDVSFSAYATPVFYKEAQYWLDVTLRNFNPFHTLLTRFYAMYPTSFFPEHHIFRHFKCVLFPLSRKPRFTSKNIAENTVRFKM
jgi:hypothetical protein